MVKEDISFTGFDRVMVTWEVGVQDVGIPEITPVVELRVNPVGNTPFVTERVEYWSIVEVVELLKYSFLAIMYSD